MRDVRIIPCLDINEGRVTKGVNFVNLKDIGDPVEIARSYDAAGADELVFLDINASPQGRDTLVDVVKKVAEQISIPLSVGGGIRTLPDIRKVLEAGAEKISINSSALKRPELISEAVSEFGGQSVIVAIDAKRRDDGGFDVYLNGGRVNTGQDAVKWAQEVESLGAGEILLTGMDTDGTRDGYDIALMKAVTDAVKIPVIASGGAGKLEHFVDVIRQGGADALLVASLFHYGEVTVTDVKRFLKENGIAVKGDSL
ncbi:MAG: imidazole glycerol phosphate synthase subunit HisF [Clostridiales bacterium]|nr:imidazole glycerol phosphate synthase subunit HisF [Clostridiales bacterium]